MGYSINFYLDRAISPRNQQEIERSNDTEAQKELKQRMETKPLLIFVYLRYAGVTVKASTERSCTQKEWDLEKQRVNARFYKRGAIEVNDYLQSLDSEIGKMHEKNNNNGILTSKEDIEAIVDTLNNRQLHPDKTISFETAFKEFIEEKKRTQVATTIITYNTALKHLLNFSAKTKTPLRFKNINAKFGSDFREYLVSEGKENSTIAKNIKILKTFMHFCTEDRDYNPKSNTAFIKFDSKKHDKEVYILSMQELMLLYNYEFTNESYAKVRDVFCFMCFTGLRFSDVEKLRRESIGSSTMSILVKKTKAELTVPINKYAAAILKKYREDERPLPVISNQKTNEALHEIGKLVGLDTPIKVVKYKGTKAEVEYVPKYEVISTHMGRKTFISNSLIMGMPQKILQEMGAPVHPQSFRRYVAIADKVKEKAMDKTWNDKSIEDAM